MHIEASCHCGAVRFSCEAYALKHPSFRYVRSRHIDPTPDLNPNPEANPNPGPHPSSLALIPTLTLAYPCP